MKPSSAFYNLRSDSWANDIPQLALCGHPLSSLVNIIGHAVQPADIPHPNHPHEAFIA